MAIYWPSANSLWSNLSNWLTAAATQAGILPTSSDDVFADGKTIYIDISPNVRTVRTTARAGGTAGGSFIINNNISLSANIIAGTTTCVTFPSAAPNTCSLYGSLTGGSGTNIYGFNNTSTGTVYIYGEESLGGTGSAAAGLNNNFTGTIFVSATIRGRGAVGLNNNSTGFVYITGNVFGSQNTVNIPGLGNTGTCIVYGNVQAGPQAAGGAGGNSHGINNAASTSILTVYGNLSGAAAVTASSHGVINSSSGLVYIIGNIQGLVGNGLFNASSGTVSITGNVVGGPSGSTHGIQNGSTSTGTIIINGNVIGGTGSGSVGIVNVNVGTIIINGNTIGNTGSLSYGASNNTTGFMYVQGTAIGNGWGLGSSGIGGAAPGIFGSQTGTTIVQGLCCGARGQWPTAGNVFVLPINTSTVTLYTSALSAGPSTVLFTSLSTNITPPASSVRLGTKYNLNDYTGTCAIPSVSSVLQGVAVDDSIGIAALQPQTVWSVQTSAIDTNSLGGRLKESVTVQSFGQLLTAFNM
jgi:hypothetical protein